jgi:hypothetical protein
MSMRDRICDIQTQISQLQSLIEISDDFAQGISFENLSPYEQDRTTNMQNLSRLAVRHAHELEEMIDALSTEIHGGLSDAEHIAPVDKSNNGDN